MAVKSLQWTGAVDGDWEKAGNWAGALAGPPNTDTTEDTLVFLRTAINAPTTNLDRVARGDDAGDGLRPKLIYIEPGAPYDIGASGAPLKLKAIKVVHKGDGTLFYESAAGTEQTDEIIINSPNRTNAAQIDDNATAPITRIAVTSGKVTLAAGMLAIAKFDMSFVNNPATDAIVVIGTQAATAIAQLTMVGGTLTSDMECTNVTMSGGTATITQGDVTDLIMVGGSYIYKVSGGTVTNLHALGGLADMLASEATPKTIVNLHTYPNGIVRRDLDESIIAVTNLYEFGLDTE